MIALFIRPRNSDIRLLVAAHPEITCSAPNLFISLSEKMPLWSSCAVRVSVVLLGFLLGAGRVHAQTQSAAPAPVPPVPAGFVEKTARNSSAPCLEPAPLPGLADYEGPMKKAVGLFSGAVERNSVHPPNYKPGLPLCSLGVRDKFMLFIDNSTDPLTLASAGIDALEDQASGRDARFGGGTAGYALRFTANYTDRISGRFFKDFAYPSLFGEDPRYYRLGEGPAKRRLGHAAEHLVVAHRPDGTRIFNYSLWLGTATTLALSPLYHPGNERGAGAVGRNMGYAFAWDMGFDVLKEFWPEIARKFKLPLRGVAKDVDRTPAQHDADGRSGP